MIILSMMFLGSDIDSPSLYNLIPVIGTALVIVFATNDKGIGKLLSIKAITIIGLLSYSLYLWHQPVFAFYRMSSLQQITLSSFFILLVIIFFLSWFTYKYVEKEDSMAKNEDNNEKEKDEEEKDEEKKE